jgi:2-keto-4-pentenoate hydratase
MTTDLTTVGASAVTEPERIADALVNARLAAVALPSFPGNQPTDLRAAYACQEAGIQRWPDRVAGWKVGWVATADQPRVGDERLVGPIFARQLQVLDGHVNEQHDVGVYAGGFGAVEAEYAFRINRDAPPDKLQWTASEAAEYVDRAHVAVEIASSPLATINQLGAFVIIADFGNNAGLLVGPALEDWSPERDRSYTCRTEIEGQTVGVGGTGSLPGGPLAALAFALGRCARNGRPLRAGQYVTTGASTGIHDIRPGETSRVVFDALGAIRVRAVERMPT